MKKFRSNSFSMATSISHNCQTIKSNHYSTISCCNDRHEISNLVCKSIGGIGVSQWLELFKHKGKIFRMDNSSTNRFVYWTIYKDNFVNISGKQVKTLSLQSIGTIIHKEIARKNKHVNKCRKPHTTDNTHFKTWIWQILVAVWITLAKSNQTINAELNSADILSILQRYFYQ